MIFLITENDLNLEIDRLNRLSAEQKKKIAELESLVESDKDKDKARPQSPQRASPTRGKPKLKKKPPKKPSKSGSPILLPQPSVQVPTNTPHDGSPSRCCNCCENCSSKHLKELLDKELEYREQQVII